MTKCKIHRSLAYTGNYIIEFLPVTVIDWVTGQEMSVIIALNLINGECCCYVIPFVPRGSHEGLIRLYDRCFGIETEHLFIKSIFKPMYITRPELQLSLFFLAALVVNYWWIADL
ncbi:MAG: hypothetical protein ACFFD4_33345 [Candidatus Odinarchaeota archaeon]